MKDIDLLIALSDDLQSQGFIEPCEFLAIDDVDGALLTSWRFVPRISLCGVFSIPETLDDPAALLEFSNRADRRLAQSYGWRSRLGLLDRYLILACQPLLFDRARDVLSSARRPRGRHLPSVTLIDRERFLSFSVKNDRQSPQGRHFESIAAITASWCTRRTAMLHTIASD